MTANQVAKTLVILALLGAAIYLAYRLGWLKAFGLEPKDTKGTPPIGPTGGTTTTQSAETTPSIQRNTTMNLNGYNYTGAPVVSPDGLYSQVCLTIPATQVQACPLTVYINDDGTLATTTTDANGNMQSNGAKYNFYQQYINPQGLRVCCYRRSNMVSNGFTSRPWAVVTTQEFVPSPEL